MQPGTGGRAGGNVICQDFPVLELVTRNVAYLPVIHFPKKVDATGEGVGVWNNFGIQ